MGAEWFLSAIKRPDVKTLDDAYRLVASHPSDIRAHVPTLRRLASQSPTAVELGVRYGVSTVALAAGRPNTLVSYDLVVPPNLPELRRLLPESWEFRQGDSRRVVIPECDFLFIDTEHTEPHLRAERAQHASRVCRWIAAHDTTTFPELRRPILELVRSGRWRVAHESDEDNGMLVIERRHGNLPP